MPINDEFLQSAAESSMLDDLYALDDPARDPILDDAAQKPQALEFQSLEGFHPLDLRHLNASDFSMLIGVLMTRLGVSQTVIPDSERVCLDAPKGFCTVLSCEINPETADVRLTILQTPESEFRS